MMKNRGNIMYGNKENAKSLPHPHGSNIPDSATGVKQTIKIIEGIRLNSFAGFFNWNRKILLTIYNNPDTKIKIKQMSIRLK